MKLIGTFSIFDEQDILVLQLESLLSFCDTVVVLADGSPESVVSILESYAYPGVVEVIYIKKTNHQEERDEYGDRQRLLIKARELKGTSIFHTDVDEVIGVTDLPAWKSLIDSYQENEIWSMRRYDFWRSAHLYRLKHNPGLHHRAEPPMIMDYLFPLTLESQYSNRAIPNYHCPRLPNNVWFPKRLIAHIPIYHYGYYRSDLIEKKKKFYQISAAGECWGRDMDLSIEDFRDEFGVGVWPRNPKHKNEFSDL